MGCQKLSYGSETDIPIFRDYEQGRALEKSEVFLRVYRKKTATGEKKGTDYYPGGFVLRESKTNEESWYKYGYQGQFAERDEEAGTYHFELREYDPAINRWLVPDPAKQYASPYKSMGNNWVNQFDPDGAFSGDPGKGNGGGFLGKFFGAVKQWFGDALGGFNFGGHQDMNDPEVVNAVAEVSNTIETANFVATSDISPYATISLGKETGESSMLSGYQSITITKYGIYGTTGFDATKGINRSKVSLSLSGGWLIGRDLRSGTPGLSIGSSFGGSYFGFEGGRSVNMTPNSYGIPLPSSWGDTYNFGGVISTSELWFSGNTGYTYPIYTPGGWFKP